MILLELLVRTSEEDGETLLQVYAVQDNINIQIFNYNLNKFSIPQEECNKKEAGMRHFGPVISFHLLFRLKKFPSDITVTYTRNKKARNNPGRFSIHVNEFQDIIFKQILSDTINYILPYSMHCYFKSPDYILE